MPLRFVFGLHNHQPVGNFEFVFEQAYRDAYGPFLELIDQFPEIAVSLHTSGPLMEWLVAHRPEYVDRLRGMAARGQVEILGGAFYEPILPGIPRRDRVGQICTYTSYLEALFGGKVRGMWLAERVWEPELVADLVRAGIEFTLLDDYHFKQAGADPDRLFGYHLTEDDGRLLKVFPISERLRYLVPWKDPEEGIAYLKQLNETHPDAVVVCADDGEKFGGWPETHTHCYTNGWLKRFFDLLRGNRDWLRFCTLSQAQDETVANDLIYLPDSSYREMTEWSLPTKRLQAYQQVVRDLEGHPRRESIQGFLRGGFWRNFKARYPEAMEMYARMLEVSEKVRVWEAESGAARNKARADDGPSPAVELYKAQCNCAHWHGAFGGLYLPHLRNAVYHHLIAAENAIMEQTARTMPRVEAAVRDFNLDTRPEVCLSNLHLSAYIDPHRGGRLYELDLRTINHNLMATLSRRPEVYHETVRRSAGVPEDSHEWKALHEQVKFKQPGLDRRLVYDSYDRKSLIDHFYDPAVSLDDLILHRETEFGDCVNGPYRNEVRRTGDSLLLVLMRDAKVGGNLIRVRKEVSVKAENDTLAIRYLLEELPRDIGVIFAVEFNFAGMAANADDRYFTYPGNPRAGQLQSSHDLATCEKFGLVDEWLGLEATLSFSRSAGLWAFPIQTVSQSEGGFELVHQSTAVLPHWLIQPDAEGQWEVAVQLRLDTARAEKRMMQ